MNEPQYQLPQNSLPYHIYPDSPDTQPSAYQKHPFLIEPMFDKSQTFIVDSFIESFTMNIHKSLSTREFLRNFKMYKDLLVTGELDNISVLLDNDHQLEISLKQSHNTGQYIAQLADKLSQPIAITPRDIFDELDPSHV